MTLRCYATILASLALALFAEVAAYPNAPGSCAAGSSALQESHLTNTQVGTGPLSESGFELLINGVALAEGVSFDAPIGTTHSLELVATTSGTHFTGFLIRLSGGIDTTAALSVPSGVDDVQVLSLCVDTEGVGGISHNGKADKTSITGELQLTEPADSLAMDVIVVVSNDGGESEWYYSGFTINAVDASASTQAPSSAPITPSPTVGSTPAPVTSSPTVETTSAPVSSSPTVGATAAPVTSSPTVGTTAAPVTSSPTVGTTVAPVSSSPTAGATAAPFTSSPTTASITPRPTFAETNSDPTYIPSTFEPTVSNTTTTSGGTSSFVRPCCAMAVLILGFIL